MRRVVEKFLILILFFGVITQAGANNHQLFDELLRAHVSNGHVDYAGIQDDARFRRYIDYLESADPGQLSTDDEKLAFWINAYNALAIKAVLDGDSTGSFFGRVDFFTTDYRLAGRDIDLYDLEHEIIIPFGEPRIHFAIVCASASCPELISEAYVADKLDQQLERNTRAFINDMEKNRFDKAFKTTRISMIFDWFAGDFEADSGTVQRYLSRYVDDAEIAEALARDEYQVWYLGYDWSLNGSKPRRAVPVPADTDDINAERR